MSNPAISNPQATAKLFGHPIHPMLVSFPIAGFVGALVCDLIYQPGGDVFWFRASEYLLGAGVVMALVAALAGLTDFLGDARIRALTIAWVHFLGNLVVVLTEAFNWYRRYDMGEAAVVSGGRTLSLVAVLLMLITGWLGWEMVYRRRVAIADDPS